MKGRKGSEGDGGRESDNGAHVDTSTRPRRVCLVLLGFITRVASRHGLRPLRVFPRRSSYHALISCSGSVSYLFPQGKYVSSIYFEGNLSKASPDLGQLSSHIKCDYSKLLSTPRHRNDEGPVDQHPFRCCG